MLEYAQLARQGQLGQLFERLRETVGHYDLEVLPATVCGWTALGYGISEYMQPQVEEWADATLALFGLRMQGRGPGAAWTPEWLGHDLVREVARLAGEVDGVDADGEVESRELGSVEELGQLATMRLAAGWAPRAETFSGLPALDGLLGVGYSQELRARTVAAVKSQWLERSLQIAGCFERALVVDTPEGRFPGMPRSVDQSALAADVETCIEASLTAASEDARPPF